jgi:hypothetical protein
MPGLRYETRELSGARVERLAVRAFARTRIFLLSPANASGVKGQRLLAETSESDFAQRLRTSGIPLCEVYRYISSLYFRGKLDYARRFQNAPRGLAGVHVITGVGLMRPETIITQDDLRRISAVSIDEKNSEYCKPLKRDLARLRESLEPETEVVLLGSVATQKYIAPLCEVFGERIVYPKEFLGLGDMSRGGMMLRCCAGGVELEYQCVEQILTIQAQKKVKRQASAKQLKQMPVKETC